MKKIVLSLLSLAGLAIGAAAQCNESVQLSSSKTYYLNAANEVQGNKQETVIVNITKTTFTALPEGKQENALTGTIKEISCDWKQPFKEGKTVIRTDLVDPSGDVKEATITIEGKDGKLTILLEAKERPDQKLKLEVDHFEQKG